MDQVLNFLGYGNPHGPVWLIGAEESLPLDADVGKHLLVRSLFPCAADCRAAHEALGIYNLHGLRGERVEVQTTWRQMCYLMLCLAGRGLGPAEVAQYQACKLGSVGGQTLLTELMPLPRGNQGTWPYRAILRGIYDGPKDYQVKCWPQRRALLRAALKRYQPSLVVCYGLGVAQGRFDELFSNQLQPVAGTQFRGLLRRGTSVLHVPHFAPFAGGFPTQNFLNCAIGAALFAGLELPLT